MQGRYTALAVLALVAGTAGGIAVERHYFAKAAEDEAAGRKILTWVAPMDPNFRRDGPGKSPMGMDLIPVYEGDETDGDPGDVTLSPVEVNAIGVRTAVARIETLDPRITTVGFVGFDQHRTAHVHVRTEGWIEDIHIRAVGDRVRTGDLLFSLYAPDISIAVSELRRGLRVRSAMEIEAATGKLRNFGMAERQIEALRRRPETTDRLQVYAPQDGVVVTLAASDGMFLKPETEAVTLTDLSSVWLLADVFERDIGRLDPAMTAVARVDHLPGRRFEGAIDYIHPELDATTRTLPVRLRFDNRDGLLMPNMFAQVSLIADTGRPVVSVPAEAVIRTGRGERVILALPEGRFRPRLVTTGSKNGDRVEIAQGLQAGERVATSAQFLIDSESNLSAGFLRMAPTDAAPAEGRGELVALDLEDRRATIRHDAMESLAWPAMTTDFLLTGRIAAAPALPEAGSPVRFEATRGSDGLLALVALRSDDGVEAVGTGTIHAVMPKVGRVTLSHDPIPALGWPAMTMDLPIAPTVDAAAIPLDTPLEFDLAKGDGALYVITAVRAASPPAPMDDAMAATSVATSGVIRVGGTIDSVDTARHRATISHDAIREIGMPGMTMTFPIAEAVDPAALPVGARAVLTFDRRDAMQLVLSGAEFDAAIRVRGTINSVDGPGRTANISHDDIAEIGMPGMTMDFPLAAGLSPDDLPVGRPVSIGLRQADGMRLEVVSVRAAEGS